MFVWICIFRFAARFFSLGFFGWFSCFFPFFLCISTLFMYIFTFFWVFVMFRRFFCIDFSVSFFSLHFPHFSYVFFGFAFFDLGNVWTAFFLRISWLILTFGFFVFFFDFHFRLCIWCAFLGFSFFRFFQCLKDFSTLFLADFCFGWIFQFWSVETVQDRKVRESRDFTKKVARKWRFQLESDEKHWVGSLVERCRKKGVCRRTDWGDTSMLRKQSSYLVDQISQLVSQLVN